jgi:uncharacterized protein (TIGR00251 family)
MLRLFANLHRYQRRGFKVVADSVVIVEDFREAIRPHPHGLTIRFEVAPGSSELEVPSGFNPWRGALEARLTELPHRGKANRQLVEEVARVLGIPAKNVEVLSGHKSDRKVLLVTGLDLDAVVFRLNSL